MDAKSGIGKAGMRANRVYRDAGEEETRENIEMLNLFNELVWNKSCW
jgi:hypothetical protein